jgi:DNA-binding MarR family transcriptional regulator
MVFRDIMSLSRKIHRYINEKLKGTGLGSGQLFILAAIVKNPGINQYFLCKKLDLDKSTVAKGIKSLINNKFILRVRDKNDMRNWILFPSKKGESLTAVLNDTINSFESDMLYQFTENEILILKSLLLRIENNCGFDHGVRSIDNIK